MTQFIQFEEIFDIKIESILTNVNVLKLLETASIKVGEINNIVSNVLEYDFIISALKNIEALNSARIEGTTGNLEDLYLEDTLNFEEKKQLKLFSAVNYRFTMNQLEAIVKPHAVINIALIRHLHSLLTKNDPATRGEPGKFRLKEVKISNSKLGDFYPAEPIKIDEFMDELVAQIKIRADFPSLLQAAFTHYHFEAIHPFEDGNGRTGRLIIVAQLLINQTLNSPVLNLSQYFDSHRDEYIASLRSVSDTKDFTEWILFFLNAVIEQCEHNIKFISMLRAVKEKNEITINENVHSPAAIFVLSHALNKLYITVNDTADFLKTKGLKGDLIQIARNNIKKLISLNILEDTKHKRGRSTTYVHCELKKILS